MEATWKLNPDSFFDLQKFLDDLEANPKAKLLLLIGEMCLAEPGLLGLCGIGGFDDEEVENEDEYYE